MPLIPLSRNKFAIVDADDFAWLSQWKWSCDSKGYAVRHERKDEHGKNKRKMRKMHREILTHHGVNISELFVDHKNTDTLDNRSSNLRAATNSQNQANKSSKPKSQNGFWGVAKSTSRSKLIRKPWYAVIHCRGKTIHKGMYETAKEAAIAYNLLAETHFGEFAVFNEV